jgi:hypothetical protein
MVDFLLLGNIFIKKLIMAILKEEIIGTVIINEIESSNIVKTQYDTATKKLMVEFKHGGSYMYDDVPHQLYTQFRAAPSQGSFFSKNISKTFPHKKIA